MPQRARSGAIVETSEAAENMFIAEEKTGV